MVRLASYTDVGTRKATNEDSHCIRHARLDAGEAVMAVVCDGVGGLSCGEYASNSVVDAFSEWFDSYTYLASRCTGEYSARECLADVREGWAALLQKANEEIKRYGDERGKRLGTTFSGIFAFGGSYLIAQIGDSRIYHLDRSGISQLTQDQTWVGRELTRGRISQAEAMTHPKRHAILQAVGSQATLQPVFNAGNYEQGDMFVLCCDGFYHENSPQDILAAFDANRGTNEEQLRDACVSLTRKAMKLGETDNITVCAIELSDACSQTPLGTLQDDTTTACLYDDCLTADLG